MNKTMTFATLRKANTTRIPLFKNKHGKVVHNADGSDWSLSQWSNAVLGELGELANVIKKIEREDFTLEEARVDCAKECADVMTYLDILAFRLGVDLGQATVDKFNEVSDRVNVDVHIDTDENGTEIVK